MVVVRKDRGIVEVDLGMRACIAAAIEVGHCEVGAVVEGNMVVDNLLEADHVAASWEIRKAHGIAAQQHLLEHQVAYQECWDSISQWHLVVAAKQGAVD